MASLSEQFLKAGLTNKKKAKQAEKEKKTQARARRNNQENNIDVTKAIVEQARVEKLIKTNEKNNLNQQRSKNKAIDAQIIQLIQMNKLDKNAGDIPFQFSDQQLKKIYVTQKQQDQLSRGQLAIVILETQKEKTYELVPTKIAEKIKQRKESCILVLNNMTQEPASEDPYADRKIPDDLMW